MTVIARWMAAHDAQAAALQTVRRIWPEGSPDRRRLVLEQFAGPLECHMRLEEAVLMPAYAPLAGDLPANGAPRVLEADHARLRSLVAELRAAVEATSVAAVLAEQDALSLLSGALEHHDRREHTWFVPTLDAQVPIATRAAWVARFATAEAALPEPTPLAPRSAAPCAIDLHGADPIDAFRVVVGRDGDVARAWAALTPLEHPRGERLMERVTRLVREVTLAPTLEARRDGLAALADAARLLAIVRDARGAP